MTLNIVIPMAGNGSRFNRTEYPMPKPLIPIHQTPMIQLVVNNIRPACSHRFIFICQRSHAIEYQLHKKLKTYAENSILVELDTVTEGAACTVLAAEKWINTAEPLMIANSDQYIDFDINLYLNKMTHEQLDGLIMTMRAHDPKWSFVDLNAEQYVTKVVEKQAISDEATVGIYNFSKGNDFVSAARAMIKKNLRVNGEFYVAPVFNQLIEAEKRIGIYNIGADRNGMYGLGTPADLTYFMNLKLSEKIAELKNENN